MTLTTFPFDEYLDLPAHRGQRVEKLTFQLVDGVSGLPIRELHPEKGSAPTLTHDTTAAIKRRLTLQLGVDDTADVDALSHRVLPFLTVGGTTYPLGRYLFTTDVRAVSTGGDRGQFTLLDEGFVIDQQLEHGFTSRAAVSTAILALIAGLTTVDPRVEATPYVAGGSFSPGQTRGQALDTYATQGDYFPYWMDHNWAFRMIRTFDPADSIPDLDLDVGRRVFRDTISETSDVLSAPNRFVVTSSASGAAAAPLVGVYDVPASAPFSLQRRGFVIPDTSDAQLATQLQVDAAARNRGLRATVFERVTLSTALDPRHDSYNVLRWQGENWLELGWSMTLTPGGAMQHTLRKTYS